MSLTLEEEAWMHRSLLRLGIEDVAAVIAWADAAVMRADEPPGWMLNVSLVARASRDGVIERLDVPKHLGFGRRRAGKAALGRLADLWHAGRLEPMDTAKCLYNWGNLDELTVDEKVTSMVPQWIADDGLTDVYGRIEDLSAAVDRAVKGLTVGFDA